MGRAEGLLVGAAWTSAILFLILAGLAQVVRILWPSTVARSPRARQAAIALAEAQDRAFETASRVGELNRALNQKNGDLNLLERRRRDLKAEHAVMDPATPLISFEVGKPAMDTGLFEALVLNRFLFYRSPPPDAARVNPVWARKIVVHIWAATLVQARAMVEQAFAADQGFEVEFRGKASIQP